MRLSLRRSTKSVFSLTLAILVVPLALQGQAAASTVSTTSVLSAARSAIAKQAGVHLLITRRSTPKSVAEKVTVDLGKVGGTETISEGAGTVTIRVTPAYAYVSGNSSGLSKIIGMTAAEVKKVGKDWVSVKAGSSQYQGVAQGMDVGAVSGLLPAAKGTKLSRGASSAAKPYILKWATVATSSQPSLSITLTISAVGAALPITEVTTAAGGAKEDVALTKWGERVTVQTPPAAATVPYAQVAG